MDVTQVVLAVLGSGAIGAFITYRKTSAETRQLDVMTLRAVITELRTEIARKNERIEHLEHRVAVLEANIKENQ